MNVLQNGRLVRFSKRTGSWCTFSWSVCNYNGHFILGVSSAAVVEVMTTYTDNGKTSSAEGNSGRKSKRSERDRPILKRIVSKNHRTVAAKVTAELSIHLEDRFHTNSLERELHKSNIHGRAAIAKLLITENNAKRRNRFRDNHKTWMSDDWKYVVWW
jgi:hypothetical protein